MIIISDFSKTFTLATMSTTWSVVTKSGILGQAYNDERNTLFEKYSHFEKSGNIEKTEEWFMKHLELFVKYGLTLTQIDALVMNDTYFAPRAGVNEFLEEIQDNDIPLYIVSSGIAIFIERWFILRYGYTPDIIIANEVIIEDEKVIDVVYEGVICPLNKSIEIIDHADAHRVILIGDNTEDTKVVENKIISLGFTDEEKGFDIKLGKEGNFKNILQYI